MEVSRYVCRLYACTAWAVSGYTNKREGLSKVSFCKTRLARKWHFGFCIQYTCVCIALVYLYMTCSKALALICVYLSLYAGVYVVTYLYSI